MPRTPDMSSLGPHQSCTSGFHQEGPRSCLQLEGQNQQTDICSDAQRGEHDDDIATGAEPLPPQAIIAQLVEELFVPLLSPVRADEQDAGTIHGEQRADGVEFRGEDLEDDEREGELRQRGPDVGAFEGALGRTHFDQLVVGQVDGPRAVHAQTVLVLCVAWLRGGLTVSVGLKVGWVEMERRADGAGLEETWGIGTFLTVNMVWSQTPESLVIEGDAAKDEVGRGWFNKLVKRLLCAKPRAMDFVMDKSRAPRASLTILLSR